MKDSNLPRIPIGPYCDNLQGMNRSGHILLLNASIDQGELVGAAINAKALLSSGYYTLDKKIFDCEDQVVFKEVIDANQVRTGSTEPQH